MREDVRALMLFFFSSRRRHTRSKRDWSSDVCSSDLGAAPRTRRRMAAATAAVLATAGLTAVTFASTAHAASGCQVSYTANSWSGGFTASISITNLGSPLTSWTLGFTLPGGEAVGQGWGATFSQSGQSVSA